MVIILAILRGYSISLVLITPHFVVAVGEVDNKN